MKLEERIDGFESYKNEFEKWEAQEHIIDNKKALWILKKEDSEYRKVCLYRDGKDMFVYGDYGQFSFDSMTWLGAVDNLEYDNIGYQMEKLSHESKQNLYVYDDCYCCEDIVEWLQERLEDRYDLDEETINNVCDWINKNYYSIDDVEVEEFCDKNGISEIEEILNFAGTCFRHTDEFEWISFLRNHSCELDEFDEVCESSLWKAGKRISQCYFICMYALKVCGEKLKAK